MDTDRELDAARILFVAQRERIERANLKAERLSSELAETKAEAATATDVMANLLQLYPELASAAGQHVAVGTVEERTEARPITLFRRGRHRLGEPTGRALAMQFFDAHRGEWFLMTEIVEGMLRDGLITGGVDDNLNKIRIAVLKLVDDGTLLRSDVKASRNAYLYRFNEAANREYVNGSNGSLHDGKPVSLLMSDGQEVAK